MTVSAAASRPAAARPSSPTRIPNIPTSDAGNVTPASLRLFLRSWSAATKAPKLRPNCAQLFSAPPAPPAPPLSPDAVPALVERSLRRVAPPLCADLSSGFASMSGGAASLARGRSAPRASRPSHIMALGQPAPLRLHHTLVSQLWRWDPRSRKGGTIRLPSGRHRKLIRPALPAFECRSVCVCVTFVTCEVRVCGLRCRSGSSLYIYRVYVQVRELLVFRGAQFLRGHTCFAPRGRYGTPLFRRRANFVYCTAGEKWDHLALLFIMYGGQGSAGTGSRGGLCRQGPLQSEQQLGCAFCTACKSGLSCCRSACVVRWKCPPPWTPV